jgi:hypothetical protein
MALRLHGVSAIKYFLRMRLHLKKISLYCKKVPTALCYVCRKMASRQFLV